MQLDLEFLANADCNDILIEIYLDGLKISESTAQQQIKQVLCNIDESPAQHVLKLVMSGKNRTHTLIDSAGQIVSDIYFKINHIKFNDIDMQEVFCLGKECYTHSFNSNQPEFLDEFYGTIGCNGTVNIEFSTPIYLWLADYL
jgi:hypothetical protein